MLKLLLTLLFLLKLFNCESTIDSDVAFDFKSSSILNLIKSNKWTCVDVVSYFLKRCATYDPKIKSIISYNPNVLRRAVELDSYYSSNKSLVGKLHCVPMIIKDNIDIKGIASTAGILAFRNVVPNKNALVIDRLNSEGAVFLAKANMAQLATGSLYESEQVGLCLNPFDSKRTCSGSSAGSAASVSAGLSVISLGTDTGGSIVGPSAFNGVFGFRTPFKSDVLDGILPLNERKDTVGPMSKYVDDLILAYSIMNNNLNLYENVVNKQIDSAKLKVKIILNFLDSFQTRTKENQTIDYYVDPLLKPLIAESINRIKSIGIQVEEYTFNSTELDELTNLYKGINDETLPCMISCLPNAYTKYWNDSSRFGPDAPYKDFKVFAKSPLLSAYWKGQIEQSKLDLNMDYALMCRSGCAKFDKLNNNFMSFIERYYLNEVDALVMPSLSSIVKLHNETHVMPAKDDTFLSFSVNSGYGFLSMPSGFTPSTPDSPDGLPFGMALVVKSDRVENSFKIAKLYENKKSFAKLPSSTPLFIQNNSMQNSPNFFVVFSFLFVFSQFF